MTSRDTLLNLATAVIASCALIVTAVFVYRQFRPQETASSLTLAARPLADWHEQLALGRRIGPLKAKLTILEFGDFECPACAAFAREFDAFRSTHPQEVSLVFRHFPLSYHRQSYAGARASECAAAQGRFPEMYAALYSKRDSLGILPFREIARTAGVSRLGDFDNCFADTARVARIEDDLRAGEVARIPGTPALYLDGNPLRLGASGLSLDSLLRSRQ